MTVEPNELLDLELSLGRWKPDAQRKVLNALKDALAEVEDLQSELGELAESKQQQQQGEAKK